MTPLATRIPLDIELRSLNRAARIALVRTVCQGSGGQLLQVNDSGALRLLAGGEDLTVAGVEHVTHSDLRRIQTAGSMARRTGMEGGWKDGGNPSGNRRAGHSSRARNGLGGASGEKK